MSEPVSLLAATGVRCADTDRERTGERLRNAAADGRLTMDELEDRLGGVYAARYHYELDTLVADLPAQASRARPDGSRSSRRRGRSCGSIWPCCSDAADPGGPGAAW